MTGVQTCALPIYTDANGNTYNSPNYDPRTDPTQPQYDPALDPNDPSYEPPGGVLPDPTGGDPTDPGIVGGDGSDPVSFAPPTAYFSSYGAPAPPPQFNWLSRLPLRS